ncbi:uncharacterized protein LOC135844274 [Planococcus citri]|uniref:uncharacterized protein LOC135844274 n=1 Tax=Planococcus citri TaxID=170843 RepID=UPI0031F760B8
MNPLIFSILCVLVTDVRSKRALLINLGCNYWGNLEDVWNNSSISYCYPTYNPTKYFAACPASSPLEQQFNKYVSLTKHSVFSRLIFLRNQSLTESDIDFCENSYKPAMIYNSRTGEYEIGYELYFFRNETKLRDHNKHDYHFYKMVNAKKLPYKIENRTMFNDNSEFVIRYEAGKHITFNFTNGYPTLGFYWIKVMSIECSKNDKHVVFEPDRNEIENLNDECKNYRHADEEMYSKKNQKKHLKDILVPSSLFEGNSTDLSCGQPYGCLTPSQIIPLWYFDSSADKLASCSYLNVIPVWKSIADGNLRRVDFFVAAIVKESSANEVIFGVNGVLKMMVPGGWRKMYLSDSKRDHVVEIPKIIYRIIKYEVLHYKELAVIVIHNDPNAVRDADRLCDKNDVLIRSWEKIINDDPKSGLTYVCRMTPKLEKKLNVDYYDIYDLNLAHVVFDENGHLGNNYEEGFIIEGFEEFLKKYPK